MHKCNKEELIHEIHVDLAVIGQKVKAIEKRLFGNGVKGLVEKMDSALTYITKQEAEEKQLNGIETWSRRKFIAIMSIVGSFLILIVQIIFEYLKTKYGG